MSCKRKEKAAVVLREQIARDIYSMWIRTEEIAGLAVPGQFISMYTEDRSKILPRPISLCEIDRERKQLRVGTGTEQLSRLQPGDFVEILGPLGNGFPLEPGIGKKVFLIGGGIGVPPMLELAKQLDAEKHLVMGYRDEQFLTEEFQKNGSLFIATEDGSAGTPGNVMDAIAANGLDAEVIYACGPAPMLRAVKQYAEENHIVCYVSMEERMACGVGACLACICRTPEIDEHSQVHNKRVCKDGPVFLSTEVEI